MLVRRISSILMIVGCLGLTTRLRAQAPSSPHVEFEGGVQLPGGLVPVLKPVAFPRQPPDVIKRDVGLLEAAFGGRVYFGSRFHVRASYAWSPATTIHLTYDRPPQYPPISAYISDQVVQDRHRALALVPSFDVIAARHVRPWIGGGVAWRWSGEDDTRTFVDFQTNATSVIQTTGEDTERMVLAQGGVRFPIAPRVVVGAAARGNFWRTTPAHIPKVPPRSPRLTVDVSAGVVF